MLCTAAINTSNTIRCGLLVNSSMARFLQIPIRLQCDSLRLKYKPSRQATTNRRLLDAGGTDDVSAIRFVKSHFLSLIAFNGRWHLAVYTSCAQHVDRAYTRKPWPWTVSRDLDLQTWPRYSQVERGNRRYQTPSPSRGPIWACAAV